MIAEGGKEGGRKGRERDEGREREAGVPRTLTCQPANLDEDQVRDISSNFLELTYN